MTWGQWLLKGLSRLLYGEDEDLAAANRALGRARTHSEAIEAIKNHRLLQHPAARAQREEILAIIEYPVDQRARRRLQELLQEALRAQDFFFHPNNVDAVWQLEGMFDRLLDP